MIDIHSATWAAVKAHADKEIEKSRNRMERAGLEPVATEFERGRVRAMREILSLTEPRVTAFLPTDDTYAV